MRRRQFGKMCLIAAAGGLTGSACSRPTSPRTVPRWRGADISFTLQEEAIGTQVRAPTNAPVQPIEQILVDHGATIARLRVWVSPPAGYSDQASLLVLAKRAHAAGLALLVDLHYSDFWADPSAQTIPAAWAGQSLSELVDTVREYTTQICRALIAQGTPPDIVQIGNEVSNGMLWPLGRVNTGDRSDNWSAFGRLLNAGIQGVHAATARTQTLLHIPATTEPADAAETLRNVSAQGVDVDLIGLSYYPFWHGPLSTVKTLLDTLADEFAKDLVIVETAYPWTLDPGGETEIYASSADSLPEADLYPPTPQGQAAYFAALKNILADVPNQHGVGLVDWEPGYLPGVGAHPGKGNPYNNLTMFDHAAVGLPSLEMLNDSL